MKNPGAALAATFAALDSLSRGERFGEFDVLSKAHTQLHKAKNEIENLIQILFEEYNKKS